MSANDTQHGGRHYKKMKYQHWDFVFDAKLGYHDGNATKYISRWQSKGTPTLDLDKAVHYLEKCIELGIKPFYSPLYKLPLAAAHRFVMENDLGVAESAAIVHICKGEYREALQLMLELRAKDYDSYGAFDKR